MSDDTPDYLAIVTFLDARISEDEAAARAVEPLPPVYDHHGDTAVEAAASLAVGEGAQPEVRALIERVAEPRRVLAECTAKRRQIERLVGSLEGDYAPWNELILLDMAEVYADHPDFDPAWRE